MLQRNVSVNSGLYLAVRLRDIELMSALGQQQSSFILAFDWRHPAYSVEKLCFENTGNFICDLSGVAYFIYEGVIEVA